MKIIDCHIHFADHSGFEATAREAGHLNSTAHLKEEFQRHGIVMAVAMGTGSHNEEPGASIPMTINLGGTFRLDHWTQPGFICYCCGVESRTLTPGNIAASLPLYEEHLKSPHCVGLKLYPGYNQIYLNDPLHHPFYELAEKYNVPVVIHTGDTAGHRGVLKYSHPLTVDEVAVNFPRVRFVMAHYGNPWIVDATEVAAKNPNVSIDLSGLAIGNFDPDWFWTHYHGYLDHLQTWITYLSDYDRLLYGSDWPLVNLGAYLEIIRRLIPEEFHGKVFFENAVRTFPRLGALLPS